jgi:lipoteichoic acid synthase
MKSIYANLKNIYSKRNATIFLATFLLWIKTYIVNRFLLNLSLDNIMQEFILLINPVSSLLFLFGLSLFFREQLRNRVIIIISILGSLILYANVLFYRFFNDFLTLPVLFQTSNASDLGNSIWTLIGFGDLLLFADLLILVFFIKFIGVQPVKATKKDIKVVFASVAVIFLFNLGLAEIQRPQLLTRAFDREILIKSIGTYNYHLYDTVTQAKTKAQRAFASEANIEEAEEFVQENRKASNKEMKGKAKGKNVFIIKLESTQSFVLNNTVEGKEITPFLNDLIKESYYFPNFYHQTGQGKTSDSEFLLDNSLYPLPSGAVFFTHAQNEYNSIPNIIKDKDYYSAVFHANNKTFWNRDMMYEALGYDRFFSESDYEVTDENSVGWGLKDEEMFEQSIGHLKSLPEPYYAKFITLTNHFPFELDEEDQFIPEWDSNDETVNKYFTTVRYMDEALERFFERLKEEDMYDDSVFILYGDHYGISENHNKAMGEYLGKEITPFESVQLQKVPMLIHIPGEEGAVNETVGGQIDLKPTILNLMGIKVEDDIRFGNDLFSQERSDFAVFRDGSFITKDHVYTKYKCYNKSDGEITDAEKCEPDKEKAKQHLD